MEKKQRNKSVHKTHRGKYFMNIVAIKNKNQKKERNCANCVGVSVSVTGCCDRAHTYTLTNTLLVVSRRHHLRITHFLTESNPEIQRNCRQQRRRRRSSVRGPQTVAISVSVDY